jgi:hypothetical protein
VKNLVQAHIVAVGTLQTTEDGGRQDGQYTESNEDLMDSMNHFGGIGVSVGNEKRRGSTRYSYAEADRHLLCGACDGTGAAGVFFGDVSEYKRIHPRALQRCKCSIKESPPTNTLEVFWANNHLPRLVPPFIDKPSARTANERPQFQETLAYCPTTELAESLPVQCRAFAADIRAP